MRGELEKILRSLETPLLFASRNDFSNLDKIPELGEDIRKISTKLLTGKFPEEVKTPIASLRNSFSDFKSLTRPEKTKRISSALSTVRKTIKLVTKSERKNTPGKQPFPGKSFPRVGAHLLLASRVLRESDRELRDFLRKNPYILFLIFFFTLRENTMTAER